jgi:hypothetical protein
MTWLYKGKEFNEQPPRDIVGFIYMITEIDTGLVYVGQKTFWSKRSKPALKGRTKKEKERRAKLKGNRRRMVIPSNWKTYNSSSHSELPDKIPANPSNYKKEILILCNSKTEMNLYEAHIQIEMWLNGHWDMMINGFIGFKQYVK